MVFGEEERGGAVAAPETAEDLVRWSLLLQKGYQEKDSDPRVSVITKLKGVSVAQMEALGSHVWDVADYTKPPQGENVFFLVTNFLATPEQVQGKCPEHPSVPLAPCLADEDCPAGETLSHSHGIKTGKCVPFNSSYQTCEIWGWCPVESGPVPRKPQLLESQNFTLLIKNSITFPKFNFLTALLGPPAPSSAAPPVWELGRILGSQAPVSAGLVPPSSRSPSDPLPSLRANTLETRDGGYFKRCRYHAQASPLCPVFRVGDVVAAAGGDFEDLALLGGVVRIQITWDCDLDRPGSECQPRYSFWLQEKGHNFRAAVRWWRPPGREARSLFKLFGIRFEILVAGQAGKFSVISTGITLGTGMALLGAATFLCDLLLLYVDRQAPFYWGEKYEEVKIPPPFLLSLLPFPRNLPKAFRFPTLPMPSGEPVVRVDLILSPKETGETLFGFLSLSPSPPFRPPNSPQEPQKPPGAANFPGAAPTPGKGIRAHPMPRALKSTPFFSEGQAQLPHPAGAGQL
ncbi:P2X purinoceptor 6 [Sarcophilus harrisii]|uniref:P2X purinoceptor 6 n=1 Tax=Sarcophilus harrisii TaxID=9305 RepID=UPI001301B35D|nr:P2X purinoceptor 6 [Sarcophilus harrisii]